MPRIKYLLIVVSFGLSLVAGGASALAFSPRTIASEYIENGIALLENHQIVPALEQFMKALILDPSNNLAKEQIRKQSETPAVNLSVFQQFELKRFLELADYVRFLLARLDYFAESNQRLYDFIVQNSPEDDSIKNSMQLISDKINSGENRADPAFGLASLAGRDAGDFKIYSDILLERKGKLLAVLSERLVVNRELRRLKSEIKRRQGDALSTPAKQDANSDRQARQTVPSAAWEKEMVAMRAQLFAMQDKMQQNDKRLAELTKEIAGMSLELYEKTRVLGEKESRLSQLQSLLTEAHARMSLVQRIIQEKDERIHDLEEQAAKIAAGEQAREENSPDKNAGSLQALIQNEVKGQIESYQLQIKALETQFADLRQRYDAITQQIQARDAKILQMQDMISKNETTLKRYELIVTSKDEKLLELDGIIKIYKGRLEDTCDVLRATAARLQALEKQLGKRALPPATDAAAADSGMDFPDHAPGDTTRFQVLGTQGRLPIVTNIDLGDGNPGHKMD